MSKGMSTALETAAQESEIQQRMLVTIYASDTLTYRFVANTDEPVTLDGNTYVPANITREAIETSTDGKKEAVELTLSNKWREWAAYLANNGNTLNGKKCLIQDVLLDNLEEGAVWQFEGVLNSLKMTIAEFKVNVERDTIDFEMDSPIMTYDPSCQWVFKDTRCAYTGTTTTCDHTVTTCEALGNILNYGGHPSVPYEMKIKS